MNSDIQNRFIDDLKLEMQHHLSDLTIQNLLERLPKMKSVMRILEELPNLSSEPILQISDDITPEKSEKSTITETEPIESVVPIPEIISSNSSPDIVEGFLIRAIRGGYAEGKYVSEKLFRKLNLEHRDFVRIKDDESGFFVEVIKKGPGLQREDRVEFKYCMVEEENGRLFVRYQAQGSDQKKLPFGEITLVDENVRLAGYAYKNKIPIAVEDLIDIAYLSGEPHNKQVIWKYNTHEERHITPQNSSFYKKTIDSQPTDDQPLSEVYPEINGKSVLVIGGDDRHADYRYKIEECGGIFIGLFGGSTPEKIKTYVNKANVVVIVCSAIRTHTDENAAQICKSITVPFTRVHNDGVASILRAAAYPKSVGADENEN
ncbi:DUF2325 domain-containing protein [Brevibacillus reuszeri]|uniref:DUF2325 domain-containing protein n=1 Tax=Brevibacillus reuszeri TaxID=54915 RepID=UPI000CCC1128|nr:DUF2325 domain-containing protein [Brevibacillus reuszeri]